MNNFPSVLPSLFSNGIITYNLWMAPKPETVACHMYRMGVFGFLLDKNLVDREKCIRMALVHDLGETLVGDITPHCGVSDENKYQQEREAIKKLADLVPKEVGAEFVKLWEEYEAQETEEAKTVRDLDKFDMIAQAFEYEEQMKQPGHLQEFFDSTQGKFQTDTVKKWVKCLEETRSNGKQLEQNTSSCSSAKKE